MTYGIVLASVVGAAGSSVPSCVHADDLPALHSHLLR